jgi:hypothetical protein
MSCESLIMGIIMHTWKDFKHFETYPKLARQSQSERTTYLPIVVESKIAHFTIESIPTANHYFSHAVYQIEFFSRQ